MPDKNIFLKILAWLFLSLSVVMFFFALGLKLNFFAKSPVLSEVFAPLLYETTAEKVKRWHYDEIIDLYLEAFIDPDYCSRWHTYWVEGGEYDELVVRTDCSRAKMNCNVHGSDIEFALYDANNDFIPELIVYQGSTMLGVFTSDGRKAIEEYLGDATRTVCCFTNDGRILLWGYLGNDNAILSIYEIDNVGCNGEHYFISRSEKNKYKILSNPDEYTWINIEQEKSIISELCPYSDEAQKWYITDSIEYSFDQQLAMAEYIGAASEMAKNIDLDIE